jgi:transcriptional regulator with XRE-family HTH domain
MDSRQPVPFKLRLKELRTERGLSQEELAFRTRDHGVPLSTQTIRVYEAGRSRPGRIGRTRATEVYRALASALEVEPEVWPEYRLAQIRDALDESIVGLEVALTTLAIIEGVAPEGVLPPPPEGLPQTPPRKSTSSRGRTQSPTPRGGWRPSRA